MDGIADGVILGADQTKYSILPCHNLGIKTVNGTGKSPIPPPEVNFDKVVEESIDTEGEKLVTKLRKSSIKTFQAIKEVHSVAITTKENDKVVVKSVENKEEEPTSSFSNSPAGYAVFSVSAMFALCICVVCCRLYCISNDEKKYMNGEYDDDDIFGMNRKTFDDLTDIMAERYAQQEYSQNFYSGSQNSGMNGGIMMSGRAVNSNTRQQSSGQQQGSMYFQNSSRQMTSMR